VATIATLTISAPRCCISKRQPNCGLPFDLWQPSLKNAVAGFDQRQEESSASTSHGPFSSVSKIPSTTDAWDIFSRTDGGYGFAAGKAKVLIFPE
jgi:hypothetical protein